MSFDLENLPLLLLSDVAGIHLSFGAFDWRTNTIRNPKCDWGVNNSTTLQNVTFSFFPFDCMLYRLASFLFIEFRLSHNLLFTESYVVSRYQTDYYKQTSFKLLFLNRLLIISYVIWLLFLFFSFFSSLFLLLY